jgi:hypothetical protein
MLQVRCGHGLALKLQLLVATISYSLAHLVLVKQ